MNDDAMFHQGQRVWVHGPDGTAREAIFVGGGDNATFFGGPPLAYVVFPDTREGVEIELDRVTARD
ncbi:hypothetical protein [Conexibacter sp. CPCC 206217]|uniref:hypothetical protein n=1 Tax=Conexibacter sp. CPCC 206217 TaxID=3064574 RepID=UPI00271F8546|nr:hypothetical protein [Conexibacter sp. CPCC 206217]MDO8213798.1 hypothetical protein [Conexibacter sp. CPCC 206217]